MNRKCIKVVKANNYKGLCIRHTFVKREFGNKGVQQEIPEYRIITADATGIG